MAIYEIHITNGQATPDPLFVRNGDAVFFHSHVRHSHLNLPPALGFGSSEDVGADHDGFLHPVHARRGNYKYSIAMDGLAVNDPMIIVDDNPVEDGSQILGLAGPKPEDLAAAIQTIGQQAIAAIQEASPERGGRFFPNGVTLIDISIDVAGIKAELKISGPPNS
jgi:hypothetical protein